MRIVKTRLIEMLPDVVPFLDVDDLAEGKGAEYAHLPDTGHSCTFPFCF